MKERPILMSASMVVAILNGTKTQTRRVLKIQPLDVLTKRPPWEHTVTRIIEGKRAWFALTNRNPNRGLAFGCSHGEIGDHLWCRETFRTLYDPATCLKGALDIDYRADGVQRIADKLKSKKKQLPWKPSIFMPRWASRITLEITDVRVERLQDISEKDAKADGVEASKTVEMKVVS